MNRLWLTTAGLVLVLASGAGLYQLKSRVEGRAGEVASLERQIREDSEAIRVLKAEWAYLSSPTMVQQMAGDSLDVPLGPPRPEQVLGSIDGLPQVAQPVPDEGLSKGFQSDVGKALKGFDADGLEVTPRWKPLVPAMPPAEGRAIAALPDTVRRRKPAATRLTIDPPQPSEQLARAVAGLSPAAAKMPAAASTTKTKPAAGPKVEKAETFEERMARLMKEMGTPDE